MTVTLPDHCTPTESWLVAFSSAFHTCIPTNLAFVSTALGTFSIISWLFAQVPQIYKNYKLKSASGLSIFFLAEWLLGDLTNLLGCLLTNQAAWQVVVAAYYVTVDICLVVQYIWYVHAKPWRKARLVDFDPHHRGYHEGSEAILEGISPASSSTPSAATHAKDGKDDSHPKQSPTDRKDAEPTQAMSSSFNEKSLPVQSRHTIPYKATCLLPSPGALVLTTLISVALTNATPLQPPIPFLAFRTATSPSPSSAEFAGRIFSWTSTLLYLFSRLPQIYKNLLRRSTSGLSPTLFIAAFFGNLFYSTSILTNPLAWSSYPPYGLHGWVGEEGNDRWTWVALAAPFWLGAAGVLVMDAIIGVQFLVYREGVEVEVLERDNRGRSHWKRVTGWMRGWVPSPSPSRSVESEGEEGEGRPLMSRRQSGEEREGGYGAA